MRISRIAATAAVTAAVALPIAIAPAASAAAPQTVAAASCHKTGPWKMHTTAVRLHNRASAKSTVVGILYKSHKWTHGKISNGWVYVHDQTSGVSGWASMSYVYPTVYTCLH
ncbi:SH3 domain-containing protein [Streptomyces sp. NPDC050161]|uniref:SH3 domain-containing protein n=1 Tax=Streptomyces sp. NPDC050161 TaxID=3365604 RepID=UPI0037BD5E47